jgi:Putative adhesin
VINRVPLTRGRVLALVIGVPLVLAIIGWTALTAVAFAAQDNYPVRLNLPVHGSTVNFSVDAGNVTVSQTAGDRLVATGTAHYSLVRSTVTRSVTATGTTVSSHCRFVAGECSFNYRVGLPAGGRAGLASGSGNMLLRGLSGYVNAAAGSGDIAGTGLSGPQVSLESGSGDITVSGLTSADVTASAGSGNVTLTFIKVPRLVSVSNSDGDVRLVLPPGRTLYKVDASAGSGSSVVKVPQSTNSPHVIKVSDGSGNILVTN